MSQTKAQLVSGTTAQDLTVDNINTTSVNSGALSNRNMIINGNLFVNQRNADSAVTINNNGTDYPCDRWSSNSDNMGQFSLQRKTDGVPGITGNKHYLRATMLSALASPTSQVIEQPIEGFISSRCQLGTNNPKTITLSFWVRSSITGTFGGSLTSSNEGLSQPFSYTYSVADTWQHVTYTFSATGGNTGSFATDESKGLCLNFSLGNSSGRRGATGSWVSGVKFGPTGETNICATNGATWDVTQVQLEVGSTATDFEHRSFAQELQLCQRYYYVLASGATKFMCIGDFWLDAQADGGIVLPVEMRATPTLDHTNGSDYYRVWTNSTNSHIDGAVSLWNRSHNKAVTWYATVDADRTAGHANRWITNNASTHFAFSAEL
jgi:hypothetical protein